MAEHEEIQGTEPGGAEAGRVDSGLAAVALAMARKSRPSGPDDRLDALLESQRRLADEQQRLVNLQIGNLEEDRALQHRHLALTHRHLLLSHFGDGLRIGLQLLAIVVGLFVVVGLGVLVWQAHNDHSLVIEAFSVPPDLARDGLTGEVVAARFLDKLEAMQTATQSDRPSDTFQNDWGSDIKVQIPETGLTFGEFEKLLRDKLGHASHVTGEVIRTAGGIAITARLGDAPPQTFEGPQSDLDGLAQKAAEAVYRANQPYRYAEYLDQHGRVPEAFAVISELAANGPRSERGWAYTQWGSLDLNEHGDVRAARTHLLKARGFGGGVGASAEIGLINVEVWSGHDERALEYSKALVVTLQKRSPETTEAFFENNKIISAAWLASLVGDHQTSAREYMLAANAPDYLGTARLAPSLAATEYALDHDPQSARRALESWAPIDDASLLQLDAISAFSALPAFWQAASTDSWPAALANIRASDAWLEAQARTHPLMGLLRNVWIHPLEALALAQTGDVAGAEALIATTPPDCYLCLRVRGQIAAQKRDRPAAERWFADAVRQAPSLPFAYADRGEARLAMGDAAGAIADFANAHRRSPHFADPIKGWGDALARQGQRRAALAQYDEALKYAPAWVALRRARDEAERPAT
jgi:tetratricopeptide (TPR) repeat protein